MSDVLKVASIGVEQYQFEVRSLRAILEALRPGSGPILGTDFVTGPADPSAGLAAVIQPGRALVEGANVGQGSYFVHAPVAETITWSTPGTADRIDTLILIVRDSQYGAISGPLGPEWVIMEGVEDAAPVALSDAAIGSQLAAGDVWLGAYDVYVSAGATSFSEGDFSRRYEPLTTARRSSQLLVDTETSSAFRSWAIGAENTWLQFPSEYWPAVEVLVPVSGAIRVSITGRAGLGATSADLGSVEYRYALSGTNTVNGLHSWAYCSRGSRNSTVASTTSKTLEGLTPGWTTVTPELRLQAGAEEDDLTIRAGDLYVEPVF